jgi:hypothetical protein
MLVKLRDQNIISPSGDLHVLSPLGVEVLKKLKLEIFTPEPEASASLSFFEQEVNATAGIIRNLPAGDLLRRTIAALGGEWAAGTCVKDMEHAMIFGHGCDQYPELRMMNVHTSTGSDKRSFTMFGEAVFRALGFKREEHSQ